MGTDIPCKADRDERARPSQRIYLHRHVFCKQMAAVYCENRMKLDAVEFLNAKSSGTYTNVAILNV
jgi:hypothetical protein